MGVSLRRPARPENPPGLMPLVEMTASRVTRATAPTVYSPAGKLMAIAERRVGETVYEGTRGIVSWAADTLGLASCPAHRGCAVSDPTTSEM